LLKNRCDLWFLKTIFRRFSPTPGNGVLPD
jgi:hypothetical protein